MDCTDLATLLSGLIDDELDATTRHSAERHLVECVRCRAIVARAEQLDTRLRVSAGAWGRDDPMPDTVIESVLRRTVGDTRPLRRARRQAAFGWLAAAAALGLAATAWFAERDLAGRERGSSGKSAPPAAAGTTGTAGSPDVIAALDGAGVKRSGAAPTASPVVGFVPARSGLLDAPSNDDDAIAPYLHGPPSMLATADSTAASDNNKHVDDPSSWDGDGAVVVEAQLDEPFDEAAMVAELREEDADALSSAAVLLRQLAEAEHDSFADAERLRDIVEYDGLVDRLGEAREHLRGDDRAACWSAESVLLRLQRGPLSQDDLRRLQQDVQRLDLSSRLERAGRRIDERPPTM